MSVYPKRRKQNQLTNIQDNKHIETLVLKSTQF